MKILLLAQFYNPAIGGEEEHVRTLGRCLAQRGHTVTIITFALGTNAGRSTDRGVTVIRVRTTASRLPFLYSDPSSPHATPVPDPAVVRAITHEVHHNRPDVAHAHDWIANSALHPLRRAHVPLVMTLHDYGHVCPTQRLMTMGQHDCSGPALVKCLRCAAQKFGPVPGTVTVLGNAWSARSRRRNVARFITVSQAVATRVSDTFAHAKIAAPVASLVIPNFIPDDQLVEPALPPDPDGPIVFVGDLSRDKGIHVLLQAYSVLADPPPLLLVGRPTPETPQDLPPRTHAIGPLPHAAVMDVVKRGRVLVVPSVWQDPCPTVVLEGMATGRPVVASAIGGITDMVTHGRTGFLVTPGDPNSLASAISGVLADPDRASAIGRAALEAARRFTVSAVVDRLEAVYIQHTLR